MIVSVLVYDVNYYIFKNNNVFVNFYLLFYCIGLIYCKNICCMLYCCIFFFNCWWYILICGVDFIYYFVSKKEGFGLFKYK